MDEFNDIPIDEEGGENIMLATIATVAADGVTIQIDGEDSPGEKKYKVNSSVLFKVGDRAKIIKNSGTYVIEYIPGNPMDRYPLPAGGSSGQYLRKSSGNDYSVEWASIPNDLPPAGTAGQVLKKASNTSYDVTWGDMSISSLANGTYTLSLSSSGVLGSGGNTTTTRIALGSSSNPFFNLYINGNMLLGTSAADSKLGFFGKSPNSRQTVANNATVATLITALKNYGLIN